jgi:hypothetical protein
MLTDTSFAPDDPYPLVLLVINSILALSDINTLNSDLTYLLSTIHPVAGSSKSPLPFSGSLFRSTASIRTLFRIIILHHSSIPSFHLI